MDGKGFMTVLQNIKNKSKEIKWTKRKWIAGAGLAIALFAVIFLLARSGDDGAEAIEVKAQDYEEKIIAVGQIQLARETTLIAEVSGEVEYIGAEDGDIIAADSVIVSINDSDQNFQLQQKKADYENANSEYQYLVEFDYASAKEELASQTAKKELAQKAYNAADKLYQEGALSQVEFLKYKSDYEASQASWNTAALKVQSLSEGGALRSAAFSKLQSVMTSYQSMVNDQKKYHITVPWNSVVLKTYVNEHDYIKPGDPLADIGEAGSYHVVTELDEKYFPYLEEGMKAVITLGDSAKDNGEQGTISTISRKINDETGTFEARIALAEGFPYEASDLTVNVEIIITERKDAIVIPKDYLIDGEPCIYIYQEGRANRTEIKYESLPSSKVVITQGLSEGDIILEPVTPVKDGKSVKIGKGDGAS